MLGTQRGLVEESSVLLTLWLGKQGDHQSDSTGWLNRGLGTVGRTGRFVFWLLPPSHLGQIGSLPVLPVCGWSSA